MKSSAPASGAMFRLSAVALVLGLAGSAQLVLRAQQPPVFRSSVELIAVDVQVMDANGNPIGKLGPEAFDVSINGKRRRVVSAQFVKHANATSTSQTRRGDAAMLAPAPGDAPAASTARTVILAVDEGSFAPGDIQA